MPSSTDDRALLAGLLAWARKNGVERRRVSRLDPLWEWTDYRRSFEVRVEVVEDGSFVLSVDQVARRLYEGWPTSVAQAVDVLAALDVVPAELSATYKAGFADGAAAAYHDGRTQWGVRRAGRKTVRITSEVKARRLLRGWIVPGELVMREIGPWELVFTNADLLARREAGGR